MRATALPTTLDPLYDYWEVQTARSAVTTAVNMTPQMRETTSRRITELSQQMADEQRLADALRVCADEHDHRAMQARRTAERLVELLEKS